MKPNKAEVDALREVLMTPLEEFVTDKEQVEHKDPEGLAQTRMFTKAIEAVDAARGGRTMFMVILRHGPADNCWFSSFGPYATKAQAIKARDQEVKRLETSGDAIAYYRNLEGLQGLWESVDEAPEPARINKRLEKERVQLMNACMRGERTHIKHDKVKSLGTVWDLRERHGLS